MIFLKKKGNLTRYSIEKYATRHMNHRKICDLSSSWRVSLLFSLFILNKIFYALTQITLLELLRRWSNWAQMHACALPVSITKYIFVSYKLTKSITYASSCLTTSFNKKILKTKRIHPVLLKFSIHSKL